jgi:hypothetical protein
MAAQTVVRLGAWRAMDGDAAYALEVEMRGVHHWQPEAIDALADGIGAIIARNIREAWRTTTASWEIRDIPDGISESLADERDIGGLIEKAESHATAAALEDAPLPVTVTPEHVALAIADEVAALDVRDERDMSDAAILGRMRRTFNRYAGRPLDAGFDEKVTEDASA